MEKIKVLLVDDDLDFGNTAVLLLKKAGYEVYFQNTLFGVESLIMKLSPNLIILDVMIGEENSLERINDIRLAAEDIPIMCVSSLQPMARRISAYLTILLFLIAVSGLQINVHYCGDEQMFMALNGINVHSFADAADDCCHGGQR